jgi:threonine dehydratase
LITLKRLADEAMCVDEHDIKKLSKKDAKRYKVIHDIAGYIGNADVCTVEVEDMGFEVFLADVVTGSMYDPNTMRCKTAPMRLTECK